MNIEQIWTTINNISPWVVVKVFILIILILYLFFAIVLKRQVSLMNQVLEAKFSPFIKFLATIHLLIVVGVILIALLFL